MKTLPQISDAEWIVMRVLWEKAPRTAQGVVAALQGKVSWSPRTIRTLLNRLLGKGALGYKQEGRVYCYFPLVEEAACVHAETRSFIDRVHGGSLAPMLAQFLAEEPLDDEDIKALRRILDQKGEEQ